MKTLMIAGALGLAGVAASVALTATSPPAPVPAPIAQPQPSVRTPGIWQPPAGLKQVAIWPNGAPDMVGVPQPGENLLVADTPDAIGGRTSVGVYDVTAPTMTVYRPKGKNTGVAMIVFPGGGFHMLAITIEGTEICDWLTARGITCILSKYRVPKTNDYWDDDLKRQITPKILRALQDAQRTIRLVRARAKELNVDPGKIGVIGFSAGGYLVAQTSNIPTPAYTPVDAVDTVSSRPDFAIALYPGHLCRKGAKLDPGIHVTNQTPPTMLIQAWDDPVDPICNSTLYARALNEAGVPTEVHLFAKGEHAFGLRRKGSVASWPTLVESWLKESGIL
jgi:acetyl esterase/lipase